MANIVVPVASLPAASQDPDRAGWTTSRDILFINLLIEQAAKSNKTNSGFTKDAWKTVCFTFNKKLNLNYNVSQFKSRYRRLKVQYAVVKKLESNEGFRWDDKMKVIVADEDAWEKCIAENPDARNFKNKSFPLYDHCATLFGGKHYDELEKFQMPSEVVAADINGGEKIEARESGGNQYDDMLDCSDEDEASSEDAIPSRVLEQNKHRETPSSGPGQKRPRSNPGHRIALALENIISSEFSSDCISTQKPTGTEDEVSYRRCIEELQSMSGLERKDCVKAASVLRDPLNRVAFVTFNEDLRREWLLNEISQLN